jgi:hypothetical protein
LGSSQKMCLTRFLSSAEDACNACCLISPQRPICAPQLAQVTALCSASSGSTTSARQPHLTQRRSNGTGNESIGEYAFQTATHLVLAKGLRASFGYFLGLGFLWQRGLSLNPCRAETGSVRWREASTCDDERESGRGTLGRGNYEGD